MLGGFVQAVCNAILLDFYNGAVHPPEQEPRSGTKGFVSDIPFSPLEAEVTTPVAAAQTNFAEVGRTAWSSPLEMEEEAQRRVELWQFAAHSWANYLERDAMRW
jgi:hypothetical protein